MEPVLKKLKFQKYKKTVNFLPKRWHHYLQKMDSASNVYNLLSPITLLGTIATELTQNYQTLVILQISVQKNCFNLTVVQMTYKSVSSEEFSILKST